MKNHPCNKGDCKKEAVGCFRPDIDIKGLCFCKEHKEEVQMAYALLLQGDEKMCKEILK